MDHSGLFTDPFYPSFVHSLQKGMEACDAPGDGYWLDLMERAFRVVLDRLTTGKDDAITQRASFLLNSAECYDYLGDRASELLDLQKQLVAPATEPPRDHLRGWLPQYLDGVASVCAELDEKGDEDEDATGFDTDSDLEYVVAEALHASVWASDGWAVGQDRVRRTLPRDRSTLQLFP